MLVSVAILTELSAPGASRGASKQAVVVLAPELEGEHRLITSILESQLADLPVALRLERARRAHLRGVDGWTHVKALAERSGGIAVVWFEQESSQRMTLWLADPASGTISVRPLPAWAADPQVNLESSALIIRSFVRAVLEGRKNEVRQPVPAKEDRLLMSVGYSLGGFAEERKYLQGGRFELAGRARRWLWATLGYRVLQPARADQALASFTLDRHPIGVGLLARRDWRHRVRWWLGGGTELVLDIESWSVVPQRAAVQPFGGDRGLLLLIDPYVTAGLELGGPFRAFLSGGVEVAVNPRRMIIQGADTSLTLLTHWRAMPWFSFGIATRLW